MAHWGNLCFPMGCMLLPQGSLLSSLISASLLGAFTLIALLTSPHAEIIAELAASWQSLMPC